MIRPILLILLFSIAAFAQSRSVAVTFDDLPISGGPYASSAAMTFEIDQVNRKLIESIRRNGVPAIGFVNEARLYARGQTDGRIESLRLWIDAGLELGNHTFSHIAIDQNPVEKYEEEVVRGETVTRMLLAERGKSLRYFRHTQLRTGPTEEYRARLARFLESRGYTVAPVTIDNQEWIFAAVYARAKSKGDAEMMKRIGKEYVDYMATTFAFFEDLSRESFGREFPQTLLLHVNALNADYFDQLALMMKNRKYRFVSLETALADELYRRRDVQANKGLSWIHRWRMADGKPLKEEPAEPASIAELYRNYK